jgi:hypothetical protein
MLDAGLAKYQRRIMCYRAWDEEREETHVLLADWIHDSWLIHSFARFPQKALFLVKFACLHVICL